MAKEIEKVTRSKRDRRMAIFFMIALIMGLGIMLVNSNSTKFNANCARDYFCVERCPVGAISLDEHGYPIINKSICLAWVPHKDEFQWEKCGLCLRGCPTRVIDLLNTNKDERKVHTTE